MNDVFVVGLATDYCVKFTAIDAVVEGFNVTLIADACRGVNLKPGDTTAAIAEMRGRNVNVIDSPRIAIAG